MKVGNIIETNKNENIFTVCFERAIIKIEFITDKIVRFFTDYEEGKSLIEFPVSSCKEVKADIVKKDTYVEITTEKLVLKVYDDFKVDIYDNEGKLICRDYRGERNKTQGLDDESNDLLRKEGQAEGTQKESYKIEVVKYMEQDESFYGLGDKIGTLDKRGYDYEMWNTDNPAPHVESFKSLYKSVPFFITLRTECVFGVYFNNTYRTYFDFGKEDANYYYFAAKDGNLDYYFIYGENMKEVVSEYTEITGRTSRPPMWSLGYHQSRWGYASQEEIEEIGSRFRALDIPCDAIHLDLSYMEGCRVFTWNKKEFCDYKGFCSRMQQSGFHLVPIIDPGVKVEQGYQIYDEGKAGEFFAETPQGEEYHNEVWPGIVAYPNFFDKKVRMWWGEKHKGLFDLGISGIWNDMNEPASFNGEIPDDVIFEIEGQPVEHKQLHNVYGHFMAKATYEGIKSYTHQRPFVVSRACFSGAQKYGAVWTGDNHSIWSHLQMSISQLCNLGVSGFGFSGCDVGGYGSDVTRELLVRWYQTGCFYPFFRNHNTLAGRPQEPWVFDQESLAIIKQYIELRYQLLPYIYDYFVQQEKTGLPVLRPLVLQYDKDENTKQLNDEFMVGDYILVAPIVEQGKTYRAIYLPEGEWVDYWSGEVHSGKKVIVREAPLDTCPMYIKAGSIIPMYEVMQHTGEKKIETLRLKVYKGNGEYIHTQDNGKDFAYEEGEYNLYAFKMRENILSIQCLYHGYINGYKRIIVEYNDTQIIVELDRDFIEIEF